MITRRDALKFTAGMLAVGTSVSVPTVSASRSDWEKPRYDTANTANAPEGPGVRTRETWFTDADVVGTPVVADGTVFVAESEGKIHGFDAEDGEHVWDFDTEGRVRSSASYHDGTVYVTADAVTYALDADDGTVRWTHRGTGTKNSAVVADGRVYVAKSSRVYALGAHTGTVLWDYQASGVVSATPALFDGNVYVADENGELHALDAEEGFFRWRKGVASSVESAPVVSNNAVYVVGTRGRVRSVERSDGDERWTVELFTSPAGPPAFDGDRLYVGTEDGVHALRASSGWTDWTFEEGRATAPSLGGGTVYVGIDGTLHALNAENGEAEWRRQTAGASSPAVTEDTVYTGTNFGLRAFREEERSPEIRIAGIDMDKTDMGVGEPVKVYVELENTGNADGSFIVTLYIDAEAVDSEETTVRQGERHELTFIVSFDEPGEYDLRVNADDAGTVTVVADETEPETESGTEEESVAGETEGTDGEEADDVGFAPTDIGFETALTVTATVVAVTTAMVAVKIARWRGKD
ncbi:MAG: PQQ-binding-like beta-propeller repeat protein [Halobacteriales archaeon]|nr:PQQ-binding-like beta-propeller repeat protein [Halobacteriales archaeon]